MKAEHRHELETNALAHRLELFIERNRPHLAKLGWGFAALVAVVFLWSYLSGSSDARRSGAWDAYNIALSAMPPNLDMLRKASEESPGSDMQRLADLTVADSQVMMASRMILANRTAANEMLGKASSAYKGVIQTSAVEELVGRAHLGLARVYEMQGDWEKAKAEYEKVTGGHAESAKAQVERLSESKTQEALAWLATAEAPVSRPPMGPGEPGKGPDFTAGDINLPQSNPQGSASVEQAKSAEDSLNELLQKMQVESKGDPATDATKAGDEPPPGLDSKPEEKPPAGLESEPAGSAEEKKSESN